MKKIKDIKNPLNPTLQQIKNRNQKWADALMLNKRKSRRSMRDGKGGRCCLQVAEDVAIECGLNITRSEATDMYPSEELVDFFGWEGSREYVKLNAPNDKTYDADILNDGSEGSLYNIPEPGISHKKIAECVLNTYVHPSKPKWTFKL
jgi:hypothetical protein